MAAAATAKLLQSCPTLCDPIDGSPPGSPVPGILQARTLEWVAISFSNAGKWKVKVKSLSRVRLLATPWTAAHQAPPSMGFSSREYWSGVPLPSLDHNGRYMFYFLRECQAVFRSWSHHFAFPLAVYERAHSSACSPALAMVVLIGHSLWFIHWAILVGNSL